MRITNTHTFDTCVHRHEVRDKHIPPEVSKIVTYTYVTTQTAASNCLASAAFNTLSHSRVDACSGARYVKHFHAFVSRVKSELCVGTIVLEVHIYTKQTSLEIVTTLIQEEWIAKLVSYVFCIELEFRCSHNLHRSSVHQDWACF